MSLTHDARARRGRARAVLAALILVAWAGALTALVRRDVLRSPSERLAELALRVNPGNVFYAVERDGAHIGWASSTIDTIADTLVVRDELVADLEIGGTRQRTEARTAIAMSRVFALRTFRLELRAGATSMRVTGFADGDSAVEVVVATDSAAPDTQRIAVQGPIVLPPLVPLAALLGTTPKVGKRMTYSTFDPASLAARDVTVEILAESLFVVDDSARMDVGRGRWVSALRDTVRAWRLGTAEGGGPDAGGFSGWVDAQGRVVEASQAPGIRLRRAAYELAFENWKLNARDTTASIAPVTSDILEATAIASNVRLPDRPLSLLRVRLDAPSLDGLDLVSGRQRRGGNALVIVQEPLPQLDAEYSVLPAATAHRTRFRTELSAEPFLQVTAPLITRTAVQAAARSRSPRVVAERLVRWVHDSLAKRPTVSVPDALQILRARAGDCNEHAQLLIALARSAGIPARPVAGLVYVNGKFYYHAWVEVFLRQWVAVDPTFGQFPADAGHIMLRRGGLREQVALAATIGTMTIDVLEAR